MDRAIPLHGGTASVPAETSAGNVLSQWIADLIRRHRHLLHCNFIAVIDRWSAAQSQQQHRCNPRLVWSHTAGNARSVMVAQHPIGPSTRGQRRFVLSNQSGGRSGVPGRTEQAEIERKVQASEVTPVVSDQPL